MIRIEVSFLDYNDKTLSEREKVIICLHDVCFSTCVLGLRRRYWLNNSNYSKECSSCDSFGRLGAAPVLSGGGH
jgi:hypothetical protein